MTNFERTFLSQSDTSWIREQFKRTEQPQKDGVIDLTPMINKHHDRIAMQLNYRELDRLAAEFEKELKAVKALRAELEKYKAQIGIEIEDEATEKIQEVLNKMFK